MSSKYVKLYGKTDLEPRYFEIEDGKVIRLFYDGKWIFREENPNLVEGFDTIYSVCYQDAIFMERKDFDCEISEQARKYYSNKK